MFVQSINGREEVLCVILCAIVVRFKKFEKMVKFVMEID